MTKANEIYKVGQVIEVEMGNGHAYEMKIVKIIANRIYNENGGYINIDKAKNRNMKIK